MVQRQRKRNDGIWLLACGGERRGVKKGKKKLAESVKSLELRVTKRKAPPRSVLFWVFDIGDRRLRRRVGDNGMSRDCIGRVFIPWESINFNPNKVTGRRERPYYTHCICLCIRHLWERIRIESNADSPTKDSLAKDRLQKTEKVVTKSIEKCIPLNKKKKTKRILIIGSTVSDRADGGDSFYPNTARNQSRWIDNRATHLSPTLLSSVHFLFRSAVVN